MLIVNQNEENYIILTLTESIKLTGDTYFSLNLKNEYTNKEYNDIILEDLSENTNRYNKFNLILTGETSIDYSSSKIYLKDNGFYYFKVYNNNDDESELLEEGFLKVINEIIEKLSYDKNDDNDSLSIEL
ncbi:hypothetical protein M0Q97_11330 [Candidatus Dojkabacteria bacterium]|jgi:hypothetical protein|nr:hypothetical protein [Candidatus Dojkabacteria bacterium]